jgi:uncharacterized protein YkwD
MARAAHSSLSQRKKNHWRPVVAVALVVLVGAGGAWLMFSESGDGMAADQSIPWSTMTDDRYVSDEPVDYTPKPRRTPSKSPSPSNTPSETPTRTPTPSETPTPDPTDRPASVPTSSSTTVPTSDPRPTHDPTTTPRPTSSTSTRPTKTPKPTKTTPPWTDGGGMVDNEKALFDMINSARQNRGCAALLPDTDLTTSARGYAQESARDNTTGTRSGTEAAAAGDGDESTRDAYNRMMDAYGRTLMNCSLDKLGVGYAYYENKPLLCPLLNPCVEESRWIATFDYR